jgi:hypothetical protein
MAPWIHFLSSLFGPMSGAHTQPGCEKALATTIKQVRDHNATQGMPNTLYLCTLSVLETFVLEKKSRAFLRHALGIFRSKDRKGRRPKIMPLNLEPKQKKRCRRGSGQKFETGFHSMPGTKAAPISLSSTRGLWYKAVHARCATILILDPKK